MAPQRRGSAVALPHSWRFASNLLTYVMVGLVAMVPRVLDLGGLLTLDEANFWIHRSETFLRAIQSGDYAATAISTHPGVTTMWLGSLGMLLHHALDAWGLLADPSFATRLALLRLPVVLVHVAGIIIGYALLRRLLYPTTALLAALLWAADPFVIGYSRLLHVDALMGTFATLSLLAACCYWYRSPRIGLLLLSGICAGLAVLSKSPALILCPVIGILALSAKWSRARQHGWSEVLLPLVIWGVAAVVTTVALWPALWVAPMDAIGEVRVGVEVEGAEPHMLGNFFLGREDLAPGPLFYPVALVLRLTPWTMLGLLLVPLAYVTLGDVQRSAERKAWASRPEVRGLMFVLACYIVLFILAMSPFPKKFNRYLVPVFPSVDILAAIGLSVLWGWIALLERWFASRVNSLQGADVIGGAGSDGARILQLGSFPKAPRYRSKSQTEGRATVATMYIFGSEQIIAGLIGLSVMINAAYWHPYTIAAFNQVFGGAEAGAQTFVIGWGEGLEQVAAWLNQQPDITGVVTASTVTPTLQPYLRHGAQAITPATDVLPPQTGYVVIYAHDVQAGPPWPPFDQFYQRVPPVYTVSIHGVVYAWIYQVAPSVKTPQQADFGAAIHLRGFELAAKPRAGHPLQLKLFWETRGAPMTNYALFAHLIAANGQRAAQLDLHYPTSQWGTRRFVTTDLTLDLPQNTPAGSYQLVIGLYDPVTQQRLALHANQSVDPALDGPDALVLLPVTLP